MKKTMAKTTKTAMAKVGTVGIFAVLTIFSILFVQPVLAADVTVSRSMPSRIDPLGTLTVSFSITPTKTLTNFDLADLIPQTWSIKDWSVSGFNKSKITMDTQASQIFMGSTYKGYHWKFNANLSSAATLTYTLDVPVSSGSYNFVGIWTYTGGFEKDEATLTVATATTTVPTTTTTTVPTTTTTVPSEFAIEPQVVLLLAAALAALAIAIVLVYTWKGKRKTRKQEAGGNVF